ncbi:MAG: ribonuclease III [Kiritimatiellia bacterium]
MPTHSEKTTGVPVSTSGQRVEKSPDETAPFLSAVETSLGYRFRDTSLLLTAFTHPSYVFQNPAATHNQRLEFLGDAVLGLLLADYVYRNFPDCQEGVLTTLRSQIASGVHLAGVATRLGFGSYLRLDKGARQTGGDANAHNLADVIESVLAAIWLDGGLPAAQNVFFRLFGEDLKSLTATAPWKTNPRGFLQTIAQRKFGCEPSYADLAHHGPDSNPVFTVSVTLGDWSGTGSGCNKREARANAAAALLEHLPPEYLLVDPKA